MPLLSFSGFLTPELCRQHPNAIFLFGDNRVRCGMAGQAQIRNEPNAYGIPTKRSPSMHNFAFFADGDAGDLKALSTAIIIAQVLASKLDVIVPVNPDGTVSLGTGLSELPTRAPSLYQLICDQLKPEGTFNG